MSLVLLDELSIEFPILHTGHRSFKKTILSRATGGKILHDSKAAPVVRALSNISADIAAGDRVALIGPNGAGKTTLLRAIAEIYEPTRGSVYTEGRVMALLDLSLGMNHDISGHENIRLRGRFLGMTAAEINALAPEIAAFTELGDYLDMPTRTYSSGMLLRLAFAIATAIEPDILLLDEWMMAGDATFVSKARNRMDRFVERTKILVLASHSEEIIRQWCNKAMFLKAGELIGYGDVDEMCALYREDFDREQASAD
ncbi:ABC transporter ATP-binding protein [Bosea sp. (in: a-proteobacteria)]|jgi:ABC-2 type transport system ATP-binding protein/lipopolysaccharide transport system ATP-binding protein|uniref:ABC transporter ATP-binding protein n=1 Tax=Bosea sp. (in: a-proteobacteria) TaxID=1871050 RepID=UPI003562AA53